MRKLYYFAAVAMLALASCTSEEDVRIEQAPQQIAFKAVAQKTSRSAVTSANLPIETPLYVTAYHEADDKPGEPFHIYFNNMLFTWSTNSYISKTSAVYPDRGRLSFVGYTSSDYVNKRMENGEYKSEYTDNGAGIAPINPTTTFNNVAGNYYINSLSLPFGEQLQGQTDVMYSLPLDINDVKTIDQTQSNTLELRHALAWIRINFRAESGVGDGILIKDVKINDAFFSGTVNVAYAKEGTVYTPTVTVANVCNKGTKQFEAYNGILSAGAATSATKQGLLVMPQPQSTISFMYCKRLADNTTEGYDNTATGTVPGYTAWEKYTITPVAGALWETGLLYEYSILIGTGTPIRFTCNVSTWGLGHTTDSPIDPEVEPTH